MDKRKFWFDALPDTAALMGGNHPRQSDLLTSLVLQEIESQTGYPSKKILKVPIKDLREAKIDACKDTNKPTPL